jgi:hypothetical protein
VSHGAARSPRRIHRIVAAGSVTLLVFLAAGWLPTSVASAQPTANSVQVTVLRVTPSTPTASPTARTIDVELKLTNTTDEDLGTLTVVGARGNPISNQTALDAAIAKPQPPDSTLVGKFTATTPVTATLAAGASTTVTYASTTAMGGVAAGLCVCESRIYPLYFSVLQDQGGVLVGSTQTYIPSFAAGSDPHRVRVTWVWPILERPHRGLRDTTFTDDDLAKSVGVGGRLDRVLQVVEQLDAAIPMTLLVDPDLIDELAVMADGSYTVATADGHTAPGTGTAAAKDWLLRLRTAVDAHPSLQLSFTPYADPDVDSLVRNGLDWSRTQSTTAQARVSTALGGRAVSSDIAWPVNGSLGPQTLNALVAKGVHTVITDDTTLPGGKHASPRPDALAAVPTNGGKAAVAVTSSTIEQFADQVVTRGDAGLGKLPELVSEVAVRAIEDGANAHYVVITPPRNVDPEPSVAVVAIKETARTLWSRPLALGAATKTVTPVDHGKLATELPVSALPDDLISAAQFVTDSVRSLTGLIPDASQRTQLFGSLPDGIQRIESSEWISDPSTGGAHAQALRTRLATVTGGVHLVKPTTGTYTLGSADSPIPITIDNTLDARVFVRVQVSTVGGLPGFTADDLGVQPIDPKSKLPLHIPVHIDRVGRIKVQVSLTMPDGAAIGTALPLSVRSTALGDIGKIITFVAGAVLAVALLFRILRRWRQLRNRPAGSAA